MAKLPLVKQQPAKPAGQLEVNHGNAAILTVKFLELILNELKKLNEKLEKADG